MERIQATTIIHRPPPPVFAFLADFEGYANHARVLESVRREETPMGRTYALHCRWWRFDHVVRSRVTHLDPPSEIRWTLVGDIQAHGSWIVAPTSTEGPPEADADTSAHQGSSEVTFAVAYDPKGVKRAAGRGARVVPVEWLVGKAVRMGQAEAERILRSVVADLEGRERPIDLTIEREPS